MGARARTGGIGFLLLVGCVALIANFASDVDTTTADRDAATSAPAGGDMPAPAEGNPAISRGIGSQGASGDVALEQATESPDPLNTQYVPVTITNHSEKRSDYWIHVGDQPKYKAGDVVNGWRLTERDGWVS
jgi:hypothetical protein